MNKRGSTDFSKKIFWALFVTSMILSTATIILSIETFTGNNFQDNFINGAVTNKEETTSLTGGVVTRTASVQKISYLKEGGELLFEVKTIPHVKSVNFKVEEETRNAKIIFEEILETEVPFEGFYLNKFRISSEQPEKFMQLEIKMIIKETEIKNIAAKDLKLYLDGTELFTKPGKIERGTIEFTATSPRMGEFVIGVKKPEIKKIEATLDENKIIEGPIETKETKVELEGLIAKLVQFFKNLWI